MDDTGCNSTTIRENTQASSNPFSEATFILVTTIGISNEKNYPCSHMIQKKESTKAVASGNHH